MPRVVVVTDSSACVPPELAGELDIVVLPISVYLGEAEGPADGDAGVPRSVPRLSDDAAHDELGGANHPFVTEYLAAIEQRECDGAVVVTPAIEFAAMYRNAALAAALSARPAVTVDARTAAAGQALVVLVGAEAAAGGASLDEVVKVIEDASRRVELVASLETLEPIRRSGPVPEAVLGGGNSSARSIFRMRDGTVEPLGTEESGAGTLEQIAAAFRTSCASGAERVGVFHAEAPDLAAQLVSLLGRVDFVTGFSIAMQVHTGPGVVGAAWIPRAPDSWTDEDQLDGTAER